MRSVWWAGDRRMAQSTGKTGIFSVLLDARTACLAPLTAGAVASYQYNLYGGTT